MVARSRGSREPRREPRHVDAVAVWVTYQLVGGTQTSAVYDCGRRTVYRCLDDVERDAAKLAEAKARLVALKTEQADRLGHVVAAATEALVARIRGGKVHTKYLVELVQPQGAQKGGGAALQVPAFMVTPREPT